VADSIVIRLDGEPQGKGRPRFVRATGRAFTPASTRSYEAKLAYQAQEIMAGRPLLSGPLRVLVVACFPIPKSFSKGKRLDALQGIVYPTVKPDVDNLLKCLDALNGVVWEDDKLVVSAEVQKRYASQPCLEIEVRAA
jgi:Holliday junction resolvase RusA-like endonuclease